MIKNFYILFLLISGFSSLALSDTDKDVTVDQAIGGMEEGRRISGPVSYSSKDIASEKHGSFANPVTDAHAHPFMQVTGNRGYMYINAAPNGPQNAINRSGNQQTSGTLNASTGTNLAQAGSSIPPTVQTHTGVEATGSTAGTVQAVTQQTGGSANVGTQAGQTVTEHTSGPVNTGTQIGQTVPEQTSGPVNVNTTGEAHGNGGVLIGGETSPVNAPTGPTTQEPSGTSGASNNPIVAVEANTNPTSGTPNVSVHTDTIGQLEDRQIVGAGVTGGATGSTGTQVGSASEITGSNTVHSADVTTQPVTGTTGQTVPEQTGGSVTTETGNQGYITGQAGTTETNPTGSVSISTGGTQEPSGTSGASNNPIVSVEAGTNPAAGTPNASVHADTSGQLEDRQIVGAGVAGTFTGSTGAQVGSASEITGSNTVHNADVTTQPVTGATGPTIPSTTEVQTGSSSGTTTQEPSGASSNPIVTVDTNVNPSAGTPTASVHTDTSGQLEDRQIVGAGVTGAATGSTGAQVGSASEITGSNTVHNADLTTQPVTGNGGNLIGGETSTVNAPTGTTTQETSGTSSNPIVAVEANTNPTSGAPNASVHTDTSGQLEDRQIVNAGVAGAVTGSTGAQVGSASEITGSNTVHSADVTTQPITGTTGQTIPQEAGTNIGTGEIHTVSNSGTTTQEPSGASNNPIVAVEANTNPTSGTPNAGVHTDTSGQLEDRQIVGAGVAGAVTGSTGAQVGSASEITGSNTVHNADVTPQPVTGTTGQTIPSTTEAQTGSGSSGTTTQEPSGTSNNPIVAVEANTNPTSGTPNASVHTDTSGQLEDRQIVNAGVAGAVTGSNGTQVGSASEITGSNTVHNADVTTQPVIGTTGQTVPEQTGGSVATTGNQGYITGQAGTTEASSPTVNTPTSGTQEPSGTSGTSNNPIVSVEAGTNPTSGTPNASVHTDTSGQLEDRQIANAGVAGSGTGSSGTQVGSASEITGSNTVHNADVTTQPVTGTTGEAVPNTTEAQTGSGSSGTTTQEPSGTSGASNNPIVAVEANTNPTSGTPTATVHTDTSGQLEDRQIANAGVAGAVTGSSGTQVGSASEITGSNTVHNADVTTQPVTSITGQTVPEQTGGSVATETGNQGYITGQAGTTETNPTGSISTGGTQEPSGTSGASNNPIVAVEANTNPTSGTPNASVHTDTSGQLEDRQIANAGVAGSGTGSSGTQVGSASEITGSNTVHNADVTTQPATGTTGQTIPEQTGGTVATQAQEGSATDVTGQELVQEADVTTEQATTGTSQTVPEQFSAGSGTTTQESSGTSGNPIVGVETGTNPEAGTPTVGASVDTTGEVEDRQFLQTDLASEGIASSGQVGSASDTTGSSVVHGADITTQPVASTTGQAITGTTTEAQAGSSSSGTTTQGQSGGSNNPIVAVDTNVNPASGTPNAGVQVNTSGQLEDRQIVDAGVAGPGAGPSGTQVGSASEITGSGTVGGLDVTAQPVQSDISAPSGIGAEVDTTGQAVGAAADVGVQADVSGVSDSSDVAKKDSADGLNLGTTTHTGL